MITGIVNARRELTLALPVYGPGGQFQSLTFVIDTGYNGDLCLPQSMVTALSLSPLAPKPVKLGDSSWKTLPFYRAEADWDGQRRPVRILCVEGDPLVGTALLDGFRMEADCVPGGSLLLRRLP
jgi:predicted aspartyl protease